MAVIVHDRYLKEKSRNDSEDYVSTYRSTSDNALLDLETYRRSGGSQADFVLEHL